MCIHVPQLGQVTEQPAAGTHSVPGTNCIDGHGKIKFSTWNFGKGNFKEPGLCTHIAENFERSPAAIHCGQEVTPTMAACVVGSKGSWISSDPHWYANNHELAPASGCLDRRGAGLGFFGRVSVVSEITVLEEFCYFSLDAPPPLNGASACADGGKIYPSAFQTARIDLKRSFAGFDSIVVINCHLHYNTAKGASHATRSSPPLSKRLLHEFYDHLAHAIFRTEARLVAGDFNMSFFDVAHQMERRGLRLQLISHHVELASSAGTDLKWDSCGFFLVGGAVLFKQMDLLAHCLAGARHSYPLKPSGNKVVHASGEETVLYEKDGGVKRGYPLKSYGGNVRGGSGLPDFELDDDGLKQCGKVMSRMQMERREHGRVLTSQLEDLMTAKRDRPDSVVVSALHDAPAAFTAARATGAAAPAAGKSTIPFWSIPEQELKMLPVEYVTEILADGTAFDVNGSLWGRDGHWPLFIQIGRKRESTQQADDNDAVLQKKRWECNKGKNPWPWWHQHKSEMLYWRSSEDGGSAWSGEAWLRSRDWWSIRDAPALAAYEAPWAAAYGEEAARKALAFVKSVQAAAPPSTPMPARPPPATVDPPAAAAAAVAPAAGVDPAPQSSASPAAAPAPAVGSAPGGTPAPAAPMPQTPDRMQPSPPPGLPGPVGTQAEGRGAAPAPREAVGIPMLVPPPPQTPPPKGNPAMRISAGAAQVQVKFPPTKSPKGAAPAAGAAPAHEPKRVKPPPAAFTFHRQQGSPAADPRPAPPPPPPVVAHAAEPKPAQPPPPSVVASAAGPKPVKPPPPSVIALRQQQRSPAPEPKPVKPPPAWLVPEPKPVKPPPAPEPKPVKPPPAWLAPEPKPVKSPPAWLAPAQAQSIIVKQPPVCVTQLATAQAPTSGQQPAQTPAPPSTPPPPSKPSPRAATLLQHEAKASKELVTSKAGQAPPTSSTSFFYIGDPVRSTVCLLYTSPSPRD